MSKFSGLMYNPNGDSIHSMDQATQKQQLRSFYWLRKSIVHARKDQYFMPLSSVTGMPKHFGKTVKLLEYVPLLDERNINDQGIDANGVKIDSNNWTVKFPALHLQVPDAEAANAITAIEEGGITVTDNGPGTGAAPGHTLLTLSAIEGVYDSDEKDVVVGLNIAYNSASAPEASSGIQLTQHSGNLYGSSKDIGTINGKLPLLSETGGRKNRVGFTRIQREGSITKFGFFHEFTQESLDFDSDDELKEHLARELMNGAVQLTEAVLQKDLLYSAGTVIYAGDAITDDTLTGEPGVETLVDYQDLMRLAQTLTDLRTPKQTKVISGSRLIDTRTIAAGRVMFIGSELVPVVKAMKDLFNQPAFVPVHMYADAGNVLNGEIGTIDEFRIVVVPEMLHWGGAGAEHTEGGEGYRVTGNRYDVFPMLVVGDDSFTNIGFQTDGKTLKFSVITKMPGNQTADRFDPYGEKGFSSIKWYYGILIRRPERLGLIKTIAPI